MYISSIRNFWFFQRIWSYYWFWLSWCFRWKILWIFSFFVSRIKLVFPYRYVISTSPPRFKFPFVSDMLVSGPGSICSRVEKLRSRNQSSCKIFPLREGFLKYEDRVCLLRAIGKSTLKFFDIFWGFGTTIYSNSLDASSDVRFSNYFYFCFLK